MRTAIPYRLVGLLLLALLPAAVFFRALLLIVILMGFSVVLLAVSRLTGDRTVRIKPGAGKGKGVVDGSYRIVDDDEDSKTK